MATEESLEHQARTRYLGRLGDTTGVDVARVEVSWYWDVDNENGTSTLQEQAGYWLVHASGSEENEHGDKDETIHDTFERLVHEAMEGKRRVLGFHGWEIDDTYAA